MIKSSSWAIEMKMFILLIFQNMKAIIDENWVISMQEELNQFERNEV